ncbi:MAG: hypothetical protein ACK5MI_08080 [Mangrovibacterium sp.]
MKAFAKLISIIFHPILLPTYGYMMLLFSGAFFAHLSPEIIRTIILEIVITTLFLPLVSILLMQLFIHRKLNLHDRKDRIYPLFFTIMSYFIGAYLLRHLPVSSIYSQLLIVCALIVCAIQLINLRWKISAHMAGIGGFLGIFFGICGVIAWNVFMLAAVFIILAGLIGTSRLLLERHTPAQVYVGFILGFSFPLIHLLLIF